MTRTGVAHPPPGVLSIPPFRRLWISLSLSSLGNWLNILTLTALAAALTADSGFAAQGYAIGGVLALRLLPAVLLGPVAGGLIERFDQRLAMVVADVLRFVLLVSVPLVGELGWLLVATFLVECLTLVWAPAKDAMARSLVPPDRLDRAAQVGRRTAYGAAPVAAVLFALLALPAGALLAAADRADLPVYVNAVIFLLPAIIVFTLPSGPTRFAPPAERRDAHGGGTAVRGVVVALVGAFAAGGAVLGVSRLYVGTLHGGDAGYGTQFAAAFLGMAFGIFLAPRMLRGFSRRRLLGLAVAAAGALLLPLALIHNLVVVVVLTAAVGGCAGVSWATARAVAAGEIPEELREQSFAQLRSVARIVLLPVVVIAPVLAGAIGLHRAELTEDSTYSFHGPTVVLLAAGLLALVTGLVAYRRMDDRRGVPLVGDLLATLRGVPYTPPGAEPAPRTRDRGVFIAFEGGEGAGKTTQSRLAAIWLRDQGYDVVMTNEPGATKVGMRLRAILLDKETTGLSSRGETLLYCADRADHVANVIAPALRRGAIVVTDRYIDSSLAYQGFGRELPVGEIAEVNRWATDGLVPDLTVLLDVPPEVGFGRFASPADRMESQPREFHDRVRDGFRKLAEAEPDRYLVIDAGRPQVEITRLVQDRIREILPDPVPAGTEDITSTFPAIRD
jgi:dTMP kinase